MKNLKVRTKLNLILALVILLVVLASAVSINNMNQVKDKALETIDASSRQSYDDSIKQQVSVVISLLSEIYDEYKAGAYTLDEAKKIAADEVRQMRYGDAGYFWIDQSDGTNVVLLGSDTEGTNRMETQDAKGYQMVKEIIALLSKMVAAIQIMYFQKQEKRNRLQSVHTVNILSLLTGSSAPETISTILIPQLPHRMKNFHLMPLKRLPQ